MTPPRSLLLPGFLLASASLLTPCDAFASDPVLVPDPKEPLARCTPDLARGPFEDTDQTRLLMLRFSGPGPGHAAVDTRVTEQLSQIFERFVAHEAEAPGGEQAGISMDRYSLVVVPCAVEGQAEAMGIGLAWGADLVLWGSLEGDEDGIKDGGDSWSERGLPGYRASVTGMGRSEAAPFEVDLPVIRTAQPEALMQLLIGLEGLERPDLAVAVEHLDRAAELLKETPTAATPIAQRAAGALKELRHAQPVLRRAERRVAACGAPAPGEGPRARCRLQPLMELGRVELNLGLRSRAVSTFEQAMFLARQVKDRPTEDLALSSLADANTPPGRSPNHLALMNRLLETGCGLGEGRSCARRAAIYERGDGVPVDLAAARRLHERACEAGDGSSCTRLGREASVKEPSRASEFFGAGCQAGDAEGCGALALATLTGSGVAKDLAEGSKLLERACEGGHGASCAALGALRVEGDPAGAVQLYQRACDAKDGEGCTRLGLLTQQGRGVEPDPAEATRLFEMACRAGDTSGCLQLAARYDQGLGVDPDSRTAKQAAQHACELGDLPACVVEIELLVAGGQPERGLALIDRLLIESPTLAAVQLHALSLIAGRPWARSGPSLLAAWRAQAPGSSVICSWALHPERLNDQPQGAPLLRLLEIIGEEKTVQTEEKLRHLLQTQGVSGL